MMGVLIVLLVVRSIVWMYKLPQFNYTNFYTFTRIDGICIGCSIALLHRINFNFLRKNTAAIVIALAILNFGFYFPVLRVVTSKITAAASTRPLTIYWREISICMGFMPLVKDI